MMHLEDKNGPQASEKYCYHIRSEKALAGNIWSFYHGFL